MKSLQFLAGVLGAVAIIALAIFLWLAAVALTVEHVLDRSDRFQCPTTTDPSTRPGSEGKRDA